MFTPDIRKMDFLTSPLLLTLGVLVVLGRTVGQTVPIWDTYKWDSNFHAWCRFHCKEKINAGNIFKIEFSGPTTDFKSWGNLKMLGTEGNAYIAETNYDIWGDGRFCQFQFGLTYTGTNLKGNCSFHELQPTGPVGLPTATKPKGIELAKWSNYQAGNLWRYQGRCMVPCTGSYKPGALRIKINVDKGTTNFNGFNQFNPSVAADSLSRSWTVENQKAVSSNLGLCQFDFQFDHQGEFPEPQGTCHTV